MKNVTPRYDELIRDSKAWLDYASKLGITFISSPHEGVGPKVREVLEGCDGCPLRDKRQGVFSGRSGEAPKMVFVCAAPLPGSGGAEYSPFTGEAGGQLARIIEAARAGAKLGPGDIALTFAVKCIMPSGLSPDPEVMERAYRACAPRLRDEILELGASVVVAMGTEAAKALTGISDLKAARKGLQVLTGATDRAILVQPTYGLKELLRDTALRRPVWDDIQQAVKALKR